MVPPPKPSSHSQPSSMLKPSLRAKASSWLIDGLTASFTTLKHSSYSRKLHIPTETSFLTDPKTMAKLTHRSKACQRIFDGLQLLCSLLGILVFITLVTFAGFRTTTFKPTRLTFYDDQKLSYSIGDPVKNWDEKRRNWIQAHPRYASQELVLLVTGSQPSVCKNPIGDHLLLRLFKNKVDYCRIHDHGVFYNNAFLHPKMGSVWAKLPVIRSAMVAHPEAEWIWWMDSDAVFTDMEFELPLGRYKNHNLVAHGWPNMVYDDKENKSLTGLNTGVVLIRNCQWSMDLIEEWALMGPQTPNFKKWGETLTSVFKDKPFPLPDEQSALIYLLFTDKKRWGDKTYLESEYYLNSYWEEMVKMYDNLTESYAEMEMNDKVLKKRHAEKVKGLEAWRREKYLKGRKRRPFVTHFTGCQPCNGEHNPQYKGDTCWNEMKRALNFADNQVLRNFGFVHPDLSSSEISNLPIL